jgi:hypothetical protein
VDYSGIYHNTGCSGISFGVKLKDFGYDVEPLSFTSYIRHYKWYYSGVDRVFSIKKWYELHRSFMTTAVAFIAFLVMYVAYHMTADSTKFGGDGGYQICVLFYISDAYCIVYYNYSFSADYLCALGRKSL